MGTKLKNSNRDITQKLKLSQNSKTLIATNLPKLKQNSKTYIVTELKNSNCDTT